MPGIQYRGGEGSAPFESDGAAQLDLADYGRVVYVFNPVGSRAAGNERALARLTHFAQAHDLEVIPTETSPDHDATAATIGKLAVPEALYVVRAGDGGTNDVLSGVRRHGLQNPVLALPGGRKNDFARQLLSRHNQRKPTSALSQGIVRPVRPIVVDIQDETGGYQVDAFAYVSAGITGKVAATVNSPAHKQRPGLGVPGMRFGTELGVTIRNYLGAWAFPLRVNHSHNKTAVDIIAANGNRMGGNLHPAGDLLTPGFQLIQVPNKSRGLGTLTRLMLDMDTGEAIDRNTIVTWEIEAPGLESEHNLYLQTDGEHRRLIGRTLISLATAQTGVNMITTSQPKAPRRA